MLNKINVFLSGERPKTLASDDARSVDVILYELSLLDETYDAVILLQPTTPYRTTEILDGAIEEYFKKETSLISVVESKEPPIFIRKIIDGKLKKILPETSDRRSQDFEKYYKIVGSIYINNISNLSAQTVLNENEIPYIIPDEFDMDIDYPEDLEKAKLFFKNIDLQ